MGGAVLALTVVTVGLDICMTRGLGVGLVTVTPWVVGVVVGWAVGFPMLVVTVTLAPAGDLGGWAVGEDRERVGRCVRFTRTTCISLDLVERGSSERVRGPRWKGSAC